jgi:hypothetical protein
MVEAIDMKISLKQSAALNAELNQERSHEHDDPDIQIQCLDDDWVLGFCTKPKLAARNARTKNK